MLSRTSPIMNLLFACTIAAAWTMGTGTSATADCGCTSGHCCQRTPHDDCRCGCGGWFKHDCLQNAFGAVGKLFSWAHCGNGCDESNCDDACDAAMMHELMMTEPMHQHHVQPMRVPPPHTMQVLPVEPTRPRIIEQRPGKNLPAPSQPRNRVAPPVRVPEPEPETDGGSLFDTLSDPFEDDDDAAMERFRSVRPSSYRSAKFRTSTGHSSRRRVSTSRR